MIIFFIVGLLLGGASVIFAFQNSATASVIFLNWNFETSLSIVIALSILAGILIALLLTLPELITNYFRFRSLIKKNNQLEEDLRKQKELTHFAKKDAPHQAAITHIEEGAISHERL